MSATPPFPAPADGIVLAHFIVSEDVERSRRFYTEVLGGQAVTTGEPSYVALANGWIIINRGGGPTDDKPTVTLEIPPDPNRTSSFLNIRVADIDSVYAEWSARGAEFLTTPKQHETEIRCYIRDPDGHLIEVGQTTAAPRGLHTDGKVWQLQEITDRLPGRIDANSATFASADELARALKRAEAAHGEHEKRTGERDEDWPAWYAAFMLAEQTGAEPPE